jgi:hypothetical protein
MTPLQPSKPLSQSAETQRLRSELLRRIVQSEARRQENRRAEAK